MFFQQAKGFQKVVTAYNSAFYLQDPTPLYVTVGSWLSGLLNSPSPVWTMLIGKAGVGGSTVLDVLEQLPNTQYVDGLSIPSLLSGSPKKDRNKQSTGGVLREIGNNTYGMLVFSDFTTFISKEDTSGFVEMMAALRRIYDGSWTRTVGADGGAKLSWKGRLCILSKCTDAIDKYQKHMARGPRFVYYRFPDSDETLTVMKSLRLTDIQSHKERIGSVLAGFAHEVIGEVNWNAMQNKSPPDFLENVAPNTLQFEQCVERLAYLASRCRAYVERNNYSKEITEIVRPETHARLAHTFKTLYGALILMGIDNEEAWGVVTNCALDSMDRHRGAIVRQFIRTENDALTTKELEQLLADGGNRLTYVMLDRLLSDMDVTSIISTGRATPKGRGSGAGRPQNSYKLDPDLYKVWNETRNL